MEEEETATVSEDERARMTEWRALMIVDIAPPPPFEWELRNPHRSFHDGFTSAFKYGWSDCCETLRHLYNEAVKPKWAEFVRDTEVVIDHATRFKAFVDDQIGRTDTAHIMVCHQKPVIMRDPPPSRLGIGRLERDILRAVALVIWDDSRVLFDGDQNRSQWSRHAQIRHREKPVPQRKMFQRSNGQKRQCNGRTNRALKNGK